MPESFTAVEYAVLAFLRTSKQGTIPAIASDLLLRLGETEDTLASLVTKGFVEKEGDVYAPSPLAMDEPFVQIKKVATGRLALGRQIPAASAAAALSPDVALVFKQARERAGREKATGSI